MFIAVSVLSSVGLVWTGGSPECTAQLNDRSAWFEAAGDVVTLPFADLAGEELVIVTDQYADEGALFTDGNDFVHVQKSTYPNDGVGLNGFDSTITIEFDPPIHWVAVDQHVCDELYLYAKEVLLLQTKGCLDGSFVGAGSTALIDKVVIHDNASCACIDDLHFSRTSAAIDCNRNGVADLIEVTEGCQSAPDCNGNLVPDECDIDGPSHDCDDSDVPDECEVAHWHAVSGRSSPFGDPAIALVAFPEVPAAGSQVQLRISVSADLDEPLEFITWVRLDDDLVAELLFMDDGLHCAHPPQEVLLTVPAAIFNAAVEDDGRVDVRLRPSAAVTREDCPLSFVAVELSYFTFAEKDLNFNGIPDSCETITGDFDSDGDVDFVDLLTLLDAWGDCVSGQPCPADLDLSGDVSFADLMLLLSNWT